MHTVRIATNPRKWRRPAPCPACRQSQPLILTLGAIYKLRTRKPVNTIYGCICPNCRHKCILHVDGRSRWCSSPVYSVGLIYGGQAKTVTEVCADCMRRLKFQPVRTISLDIYRLFEKWLDEQKETER